MVQKMPEPPTTERSFINAWAELDYLCKKVRYWLYARKSKARAARYLDRLERVLDDLPENDVAIVREEGWALLYELKGELPESITHRRQEIELMERLHKESNSPKYSESTRAYMLRDRGTSVLKERRAILKALLQARAQECVGVTRGGR